MVAIWLRCGDDGELVVEVQFRFMVLMLVFSDEGELVHSKRNGFSSKKKIPIICDDF